MSPSDRVGGGFDLGVTFTDVDRDHVGDHRWLSGRPHFLRADPYLYICGPDQMVRYGPGLDIKHRRSRPTVEGGNKGPGWAVFWDPATKKLISRPWRDLPGAPIQWGQGFRYLLPGRGGVPAGFRAAEQEPRGKADRSVATRVPYDVDQSWEPTVDVPAMPARQARQTERQLVRDYCLWRHLGDKEFSQRHISRLGLRTDGFLDKDRVLIEAKATARREDVRMAMGQLYDYERFIGPRLRRAILLPKKPTGDLLDLLSAHRIEVIWRHDKGFDSTDQTLVSR